MKIYVDEMPKSCNECDLKVNYYTTPDGHYASYKCPFIDGYLAFGENSQVRKCPLHSISEVQNEKVVEVLEKVKEYAIKHYNEEETNMSVAIAYRKCATRISEEIDELKGGAKKNDIQN